MAIENKQNSFEKIINNSLEIHNVWKLYIFKWSFHLAHLFDSFSRFIHLTHSFIRSGWKSRHSKYLFRSVDYIQQTSVYLYHIHEYDWSVLNMDDC